MIVDIEKVVVRDRIRKDFGDIQELADDIMQNGLINPPVVNKDYELLAGERRLRACKSLGWSQIEVRMMDTRDAEHELNVEISENDVRKGFTKSERVDYMKRLLRIEQAKAKDRMAESGGNISTPTGKSRDITAEQFGISGKTMEKEMTIVENRNLLDPSDFADWDEGKLSTNKAFLKVKNRQKELEEENRKLREAVSLTGSENAILKKKLEDTPIKEVVKEIKVEVVPDDYEALKSQAKNADIYQKDFRRMQSEYEKMSEKWKQAEREKEQIIADRNKPESEKAENLKRSALFFCAGVSNFIEKYGGYVWLTQEIDNLEESEKEGYLRAVSALDAWVFQMKSNLEIQ